MPTTLPCSRVDPGAYCSPPLSRLQRRGVQVRCSRDLETQGRGPRRLRRSKWVASCGGHTAPGRRPVWRRRPAAANERMRDTNSATQTLPGALNDRPPHSARRRAWLGARRRTETRRPLQAAGRRWGLRALCASGPDGPAAFTCLVLGQEVCGTQGTTSPPPPCSALPRREQAALGHHRHHHGGDDGHDSAHHSSSSTTFNPWHTHAIY
jgi:hypothetical protein